MNVCIVSCEKIFARMLELELLELSANVKTISEKLSPPALKIAVSGNDLIVFDAQYYSNDVSFASEINVPFVIITKNADGIKEYENIKGVFERPFPVDAFIKHISELGIGGLPLQKTLEEKINIELDQFSKQAVVNGKVFKFSPKEFSLLSLLYKNRGRAVSRDIVLETVWGKDYDKTNNVDNVYINYLRKKLDSSLGVKMIYTVRGKGYMMK